MLYSGFLRRVTFVRTDVWAERITAIIRATRIGELGKTLAVTSNRSTLRRTCVPTFFTLAVLLDVCAGSHTGLHVLYCYPIVAKRNASTNSDKTNISRFRVIACRSYEEGGNGFIRNNSANLRFHISEIINLIVRFEVFTAVTIKNGFFLEVTQCASCKSRRFGGT
jgi:hypothetical protein